MKAQTKSANMHIRVNPEVKDKAMDSKYICAHGYVHDYTKTSPSPEEEYHTFDSWKEAKERLRA